MMSFVKNIFSKMKGNKQDKQKKQGMLSGFTKKFCNICGIKTKSKFQQVYAKIEGKVADEVNDIKEQLGLPANKTKMQNA